MGVYGNYIDSRISILSEAYFGKSETLIEMEKQIGLIRAQAAKKYSDINHSKEVLALNRLFEKQFGMEIFALHVEQNNTINAYTIPIATRFDIVQKEILSKKVVATKENGYRFTEGNNLCIVCSVYLGLLNLTDLTDAEILAIILHELGHNFADAISKNIEVANKETMSGYLALLIYYAILGIIVSVPTFGASLLLTLKSVKDYLSNLNSRTRKKEKKTRRRIISSIFKGVAATVSDFSDYVNEILTRMGGSRNINAYLRRGTEEDKQDARKSVGRQNEVIADKFAAVYGYGPELSSALIKMDLSVSKAEEYASKKYKAANDAFNEAVGELYKFDCHPHTIQRLNEAIKTLEAELTKEDIDPKLTKAMKQQINELKKLRDKATKITNNMTDKQKIMAKTNAKVLLEDPDALDEALENEISKAFDDMLED